MNATLTLEQLYDSYQALDRLGKRDGIKAAPAWWLASLLRKLKPDFESFSEKRQAVLEKYGKFGKPNDNGTVVWQVEPANQKAFFEEYNPLLAEEINVDINRHSLAWLSEDVSKNIEPELVNRIRPFIERPSNLLAANTEIELRLLDGDEAMQALAAMATYRMAEDLAWWLVDLTNEIREKAKELAVARQTLLDMGMQKQATEVAKNTFKCLIAPRQVTDFGDLIEKWHPGMLTAIMFALIEPAEKDVN